jgi:hypothetical protein
MMNMINKKLIMVAFIIFLLSSAVIFLLNKKNKYSLIVINNSDGWGYDILYHNRIIIHQPFMPGLSGHIAFKDKKSARTAGRIVIKKLLRNQSSIGIKKDTNSIVSVGSVYSKNH